MIPEQEKLPHFYHVIVLHRIILPHPVQDLDLDRGLSVEARLIPDNLESNVNLLLVIKCSDYLPK